MVPNTPVEVCLDCGMVGARADFQQALRAANPDWHAEVFRYLPDGQDYPWYIESHYDEDDKTNKYDASIWYSMEVLNTGAAVILDGIDEGNVVTTTTTTA